MLLDDALLFWSVVFVQVVGFVSMVAARLSERTEAQHSFQAIFFACLLLMAVAAISTLAYGNGYGFSFGVVVSLMAVGATLDLRKCPQVAV